VADDLLVELFLTVSPVLVGRADNFPPWTSRRFLPGRTEQAEMVSVRQCGSSLFLRYRLLRKESAGSLYDHGHQVGVRSRIAVGRCHGEHRDQRPGEDRPRGA
jgi:hypothetical protein